jgi:predicted PurR-regulated permease PerM
MHAELTHIPVSPRTRNILLAIVAGLILLIFWKAPTLPKLLLTGMAVALILSFPVKYLSKIIPRGIAIAIVVIALLALLVVGAIVLVPLAVSQLASLAEQAPRLLDEAYAWARRVVENLAARGLLDTTPDEAMADLQQTGAQRVNGLLGDVVTRAFDTLSGTVGGVFTTLSVILIAAYLLADGERFKLGCIRFLPVQYRDDALVLFSDVIDALSRYLSGLLV